MFLYYGSSKPVKSPAIPLSEVGKEFGIGFYAFTERMPAEAQAARAAKKAFFYDNPRPTVTKFQFDPAKLPSDWKLLKLNGFDRQWLDFVFQCYTDIHFVHPYDIVIGNAVTSEVSEVLNAYRRGSLNQEITLQMLSSLPAVKQVCFSTARALERLKITE